MVDREHVRMRIYVRIHMYCVCDARKVKRQLCERVLEMAEVFACLVYVLDGSTVSIDVNVSI